MTGGIGSGKSTILAHFAALGFSTISADDVARDVFATDTVQSELATLLDTTPPVAPSLLRAHIAEDVKVRRAVNAIMHPPIRQIMRASGCTVSEVPLLIESCTHARYDYVILAVCDLEVRKARLRERYGENARFEAIFSTQLDDRAKMPFADQIIRTDQPLANVHTMIEIWVKEFVAL